MTNSKLICGIDPGKSGAAAVIGLDGSLVVHRFDKATPHETAAFFLNTFDGQPAIAYLEQVGAMPGQGVTSMFSFGESVGFVTGLLVAYSIPFVHVRPQAWQKAVGFTGKLAKTDRKKALKQLAQQFYPACTPITNDMADAILIAHYGLLQERRANHEPN